MKEERCETIAKYLLANRTTIRNAAKHFGLSKTTIHNDVSNVLKKVNYSLYDKTHKLLEENYNNRCYRGGKALAKKYKELKDRK